MLQTQLNLLRERLILVEQKSGKQKLKELEDDLEYSEDEAEAQLRRDFETIRCNVLEAAFKELQEDRVLLVRTIQ